MISYTHLLPFLAVGIALFIVKILWSLVYNIHYHPLSKFPGPKIAGASRLYENYFEALKSPGGQYIFEIDRLHKIYGKSRTWYQISARMTDNNLLGPIVRVNPNELHIKDLDFSDTLYALGAKRNKDAHHIQMFGLPLSCEFLSRCLHLNLNNER